MHPLHIVSALFTLAVTFGVAIMFLKHPDKVNSLFAASADTISGVTKALEGR